jgi:hypothetical protein
MKIIRGLIDRLLGLIYLLNNILRHLENIEKNNKSNNKKILNKFNTLDHFLNQNLLLMNMFLINSLNKKLFLFILTLKYLFKISILKILVSPLTDLKLISFLLHNHKKKYTLILKQNKSLTNSLMKFVSSIKKILPTLSIIGKLKKQKNEKIIYF